MNLQSEISDIKGVGEKYKKNLSKINIKTIEDLLLHIPYRYDDLSNIKNISDLFEGETATVIGEVLKIDNIYTRYGKRLTKAVIKDNSGKLDLIWFNQHYIKNSLQIGTKISVSGRAEFDKNKFKYISPNWEVVKNGQTIHTTGIVPVYNLTEGISQKWIRMKIKEVLDVIIIDEILPKYIIDENKLLSRPNAFDKIHFPKNLNEVEDSRRTLSFEEMIFLHLRGIKLKKDWQKKVNGHKIEFAKNKLEEFIKNLPFTLTKSQLSVIDEILEDLKSDVPMNRLLQGDVGSGKTVVAAAAIAAAATHNSIYLAPTQILAKQTYAFLKSILSHTNIQLKLITSDTKDISNLN
ncbi:hypothetical protein CO178_00515 [candidate division WWE3 bacterium CG_4_9_14_3_um_filter_34_6]|uniref:ATP-dependent DNA helicase RecG n=1 Tax=candidate division WWE3 bacterium CG_4_9_14_3_um_filter_34_6 TaxID=1975079 RepID=A0A2M7X597_UNCKA|nr:MAG: hypothetical protein CO178_00515 [candidate division WWE3 bacterium CG_4_9_14_3_um_filter_34_6]